MNDVLLEAIDLSIETSDHRPLAAKINFKLLAGECAAIRGPNGSGKTSLLKAFLKLHPLKSGSLSTSVGNEAIEYLPQLGSLRFYIPLKLGDLLLHNDDADFVDDYVQHLALRNVLQLPWNSASGGERQRVLIARALVNRPRLLLLDEPLNHLDETSRKNCVDILRRFLAGHNNKKNSIVFVSHSQELYELPVAHCIDLGSH